MHTFLDLHTEDFIKHGFTMIGDGVTHTAPLKLFRAVHQTFRGEPMPSVASVTVEQVSNLAKSYPAEWKPSEYT